MSYSPTLERFLEQDPNPAGQYNDGASLYQIEGANPIGLLDPFGYEPPATQPGDPPSKSGGVVPNEPDNPKGVGDDQLPSLDDLPVKVEGSKLLERAIRRVFATARGKAIADELRKRGGKVTIRVSTRRSETTTDDDGNANIGVHLTQKRGYLGSDGKVHEFTLERIVAHELGHAAGATDDGTDNMNNIHQNENPIMDEFEGEDRISYDGYYWNGVGWVRDTSH